MGEVEEIYMVTENRSTPHTSTEVAPVGLSHGGSPSKLAIPVGQHPIIHRETRSSLHIFSIGQRKLHCAGLSWGVDDCQESEAGDHHLTIPRIRFGQREGNDWGYVRGR